MFPRILNRFRDKIRTRQYLVTLHAEQEMDGDDLTIHDLERGILMGEIVERQKDKKSGEWKYRIRGEGFDGEQVEVIAKLSPTGKAVIITVYRSSQ